MSSAEEPFVGWIDNFNGPSGLLLAAGHGIIRKVWARTDAVQDYIPVDQAIQACIVGAWYHGLRSVLIIFE